jgi:poly(U)-specific endoribonuclease
MKKLALPFALILFPLGTFAQDNQLVDGNFTVQGDLVVNGNLTINGNLIVNGNIGQKPIVDGEEDSSIFVELWKLDQHHNGLSVTLRGSDGEWLDSDADIRLDEQGVVADGDQAPNPLLVVHRPEKFARPTYRSVQKLFDNYTLKDGAAESTSDIEQQEIDTFLNDILQTEVMKRCLAYVNSEKLAEDEEQLTTAVFKALLKHQWFELYTNHFSSNSPNPQVSGFEHVFVGDENRSGGIGGHHFWWKFLVDQEAGQADSLGHNYELPGGVRPPGERYAWLATFGMTWTPNDRVLGGPKKGFFVGFSSELMIAYGTLALLMEQKTGAHQDVTLEGGEFELVVHASALLGPEPVDQRRGTQIRSVFPILKSLVSQAKSLSVTDALAKPDGESVSVVGIVTREHNGQFGLQLTDVVNPSEFLVVKLPEAFRSEFNPLRNNAIVGQAIVVHGVRGLYTGTPGVVDVHRLERKPE